jgi:putative ABC transport system permease protein
MQASLTDVQYAWRKLFSGSAIGGTLVAIASIGLGVGVSTAIFGAVDQILLSALPYPEPQRVIVLNDRTEDDEPLPVAYGTFLEIAQRNRSFDALAVLRSWQPSLTAAGEPARLAADLVSPDYFAALGVRPSLGRDFAAGDDVTGAPPVVIVSTRFAERRFGSATAVLDRTITLDGESYTVVGVMPEGFEDALSPAAELWAPLRFLAGQPFESREWGHNLRMVGRLREGVPLEQAQREMVTIGSSPVAEFPRPTHASMPRGLALESLHASVTSGVRPALLPILGAVLLLLAIACANVTNILLARVLARRAELATRAALGAQPGRLARQLFAESALLISLGGVLGVGVAALASRALVVLAPADLPRLNAIGLDARVLAFALATTAVVALVAGLWPALRARDIGSPAALRTGPRATGHAFATLRKSLVVGQIALATVLLASAGLLLRSVEQVLSVPTGFDASRVVTMQVVVPPGGGIRSDAEELALFERVLEAVLAVPGVAEAALTSLLPLSGSSLETYGVFMESTAGNPENAGVAYRYAVTPEWFATMGIPLMRGRLLGTNDGPGALQAVLINESFAARRFAGRDPVGERVKIGPFNRPDGPWGTIVGVVGDVKQTSLAASTDAFYVALGQWASVDPEQWLVVKTTGDPVPLVEPLKQAIWSVNPSLPLERITTMSDLVTGSEAQRSFALTIFAAFGLAALLLAGVGVYGVIEGSVTERTREIGVRSALGATPARLAALVVGQGLVLTAIGIALGALAAAGATQTIASLLFGVEPFDPATYAGVVALWVAVAFIACYAPASRAARVDPAITLRADA